jgi:hypothetical protein
MLPLCLVGPLQGELEAESLWTGGSIKPRDGNSRLGNLPGRIKRMKVSSVLAETRVPIGPPARSIASEVALQGADLARAGGLASQRITQPLFRTVFKVRPSFSENWGIG